MSLPQPFVDAVKKLELLLENQVFVLFLNQNLERIIVNEIYNQKSQFQKNDEITILLNSGGGSIDAAYQIVQFFRARCKKVQVFVPRWAKSAATFICLGSDEIVMSEIAELGPLDAQLTDPRNPLNTMSALDGFKALEALRKFAMESLELEIRYWLQNIRQMPLKDILEQSNKFVGQITSPIFAKFEPLDLGGYSQALRLGGSYLERVIGRTPHGRKFKRGQQGLIDEIIWGYPSHSFVIDLNEAKKLDLNARLPTTEESAEIDKILPYCGQVEYVGFIPNDAQPISKPKENKSVEVKAERTDAPTR